MKKVLLTVLLVLWASTAFAWNDNVHNCQGNSCNTYNDYTTNNQGGEGGSASAEADSSSSATSTSRSDSSSSVLNYNMFRIDTSLLMERSVIETVQPSNRPMPLVKGDVWNFVDKWGEPFGSVQNVSTIYKDVIKHEYTLDFTSFLAFRKIRTYDIERLLIKLSAGKPAFAYKVMCYDGQSGWGAPAFLGGGGVDSTGLSTVTGSIMPTYNRSDADPACIILEFVK